MKLTIVIVVFLFVLKPILPVMDYVFNYDYIIKELCENKAKPEMQCNGKCHLMKELAKASENDNPVSNDKKAAHGEFEVLFFQPIAALEISVAQAPVLKETAFFYANLYSFDSLSAVFHPPSFMA